jgi:hypothetical protein
MPAYNKAQKDSLQGSRKNYWVVGKDGVRRGPALLNRDGVEIMKARGATCIPLAQGEFWTTEHKPES